MQVSKPTAGSSDFVNENLALVLHLQHFGPFISTTLRPAKLVQIPARYYERIPKFYFIVGILLLVNSIYMGMGNFAAYFYFAFGILPVLYAVSVHIARSKYRKNTPLEESQQSASEVHDLP